MTHHYDELSNLLTMCTTLDYVQWSRNVHPGYSLTSNMTLTLRTKDKPQHDSHRVTTETNVHLYSGDKGSDDFTAMTENWLEWDSCEMV